MGGFEMQQQTFHCLDKNRLPSLDRPIRYGVPAFTADLHVAAVAPLPRAFPGLTVVGSDTDAAYHIVDPTGCRQAPQPDESGQDPQHEASSDGSDSPNHR